MNQHLPDVYLDFRARFPQVSDSLDSLAREVDSAGPLDDRTVRLVKLGIAVALQSPGAVRSNVRKALDAGASADEVQQAILLALTTAGFPAVVAALQWAQEVLETR